MDQILSSELRTFSGYWLWHVHEYFTKGCREWDASMWLPKFCGSFGSQHHNHLIGLLQMLLRYAKRSNILADMETVPEKHYCLLTENTASPGNFHGDNHPSILHRHLRWHASPSIWRAWWRRCKSCAPRNVRSLRSQLYPYVMSSYARFAWRRGW